MPRKGAATAAPPTKPTENLGSEETMAEVAYNESVAAEETQVTEDKPKPARRGGRKAAERNPETPSDKAIEDWTKPDYADNPGEFEFDMLDDADEWYRVLWFGVEGTGKTSNTMLVTKIIPDTGKVLLINAEAGAKRSALAHHGVDTSRVALFPPKGQQLTFEGLERLFYRIQADLAKDPLSWGAVVWDSITAIYQKLLDDVIEADIRKQAEILQRAGKQRGGRAGNITLRDRFDTDRDDYASMSNQVRLLLRKYRSLHCHLLITALERRDEIGKGADKRVEYGPAISPALSVDLLGYMDAVIHTRVTSTGVFVGRSQPTEDTRGKDRLNALPIEMVDPTIERVHAYVSGALEEASDPAQEMLPDREVQVRRRSLADGYDRLAAELASMPPAPHHTKDGTASGEPLEGDKDDPEPPKRGGRRTARSSTPAAASKTPGTSVEEPSGSAPENPPDPGAEPPKASGRKSSSGSSARSAEGSEETTSGTEVSKPSGGRKTAAQRKEEAARKEAQAEGLIDKTPPKRSGRRTPAKPAEPKRSADIAAAGGFNGEPPF
jgi:hypothetical protein